MSTRTCGEHAGRDAVPDFVMSRHATQRAVEMAVTAEEILAAWERPLHKHFDERRGSWRLTRHRVTLCVVEDAGRFVVTTVLFARASDWAEDAQLPPAKGREDKDMSGVRSVRRHQRHSRGGRG